MNTKTPILTILLLSLTLLVITPTTKVHANPQTSETTWSPFGPRSENMIITGYSDFGTMFNAFTEGQVDITDWPAFPSDIAAFGANPDFFLTNSQPEFGLQGLFENHNVPVLGVTQEVTRTLTAPSVGTVTRTTGVCPTGFGRLTVSLNNQEVVVGGTTGIVKDSNNKVIAVSPSFTFQVTDSGGATPNGNYIIASPTSCAMKADTYTITSTEYDTAKGTVTVGSTESDTVTITVNYNSPSTKTPTQAGTYFRMAIGHMLDKSDFVTRDPQLAGQASCLDIDLPAINIPGSPCTGASAFPASVLNAECPASGGPLVLDTVITACNPVSIYNLVADKLSTAPWWGGISSSQGAVGGYSGAQDIDAACQLLVKAGFTFAGSGVTSCVGLANDSTAASQPASYTNDHLKLPTSFSPLIFYIRSHHPRRDYGQIIADTVNFLFGTPNNQGTSAGQCAVNYGIHQTGACPGGASVPYYSITQVIPIVFAFAGRNNWNFYTVGFSVGSTPDFLWANYHSQFAGTACGGPDNPFPANDQYWCDPLYDAYSNAGEFASDTSGAPSLSISQSIFTQTGVYGYATVALDTAVYSKIDQFVALNCLNFQPGTQSSLVRQLGHGWETAYWSLLNARVNPAFTPTNSLYKCGGGNPDTLRRGFSQDTDNFNLFQAQTVWDFEVINQIFDSMLVTNPITGGATQQVMDWMTNSHTFSPSVTEVSCVGAPVNPTPVCVTGTTTWRWILGNNVFFHDGVQVTADDVCFSIIAQRDVPSVLGQSGVINVASCTTAHTYSSSSQPPDTAIVKVQLTSPYQEINIGGVPIIPAHGPHSWVTACGGPLQTVTNSTYQNTAYSFIAGAPNSDCANANWDPSTGRGGPVNTPPIMVGSGPWVCKIPAGFTYTDALGTTHQAGEVGGPCTENAAGNSLGDMTAISVGGRGLLTANHNYVRGPPSLQGTAFQAVNWADKGQTGRISDYITNVADMGSHYCLTQPASTSACGVSTCNSNGLAPPACDDPYWAHPSYVCPGDTWVDICAAATVAGDVAAVLPTNPFTPAQLVSVDPQVHPIFVGATGSNINGEKIVNEGGLVHVLVADEGTTAGSITGGSVTVTQPSPATTSIGASSLTANAQNDINTGVSFPATGLVTVTLSVSIGSSSGTVTLRQSIGGLQHSVTTTIGGNPNPLNETLTPSNQVVLSVTVTNNGGFAETNIPVQWLVNATVVHSATIASLAIGASTTLTFTWTAPTITAAMVQRQESLSGSATLGTGQGSVGYNFLTVTND